MNYANFNRVVGRGVPVREVRKFIRGQKQHSNIAMRPCPESHRYKVGEMCGPYRLTGKRGESKTGRAMFWDAVCPVCGYERAIPVNNMSNVAKQKRCTGCIEIERANRPVVLRIEKFANNGAGDARAAREIAEMRSRIARQEEAQWQRAARRSG